MVILTSQVPSALAKTAIPVSGGGAPWHHELERLQIPTDPAIARADQQGLAAVMVIGEALFVEDRNNLAVAEDARCNLIHAVSVVL
jgi:hypothetical protein